MKKLISVLVVATILLVSGMASAHIGHNGNPPKKLSILVNGVEVQSELNQVYKSKVYVSVSAFANLFGETYKLAKNKQSLLFEGKTIKSIKLVNGKPTARINDLAAAVNAQQVSWDAQKQEAYVLVLPKGTVQLDPHVVPAMGEHWANPKDLPAGPIYGVYKGKLVFLEYMIAQEDFAKGLSKTNLEGMKGLPSPSVVQTDIDFEPQGHPGYTIPHFDIHSYFISDEEQQKIK